MEFYSAIRTNDIMGFKGKWMQLVDIMLSDVNQFKKDIGHMFISHMWKIDPNDKFIHKNKHDHIQTHMQNMFAIVELLYGNWERNKEKRLIEQHQQCSKT
jgi:hypothetical protein